MGGTSPVTIVTFIIYIAGVFVLAGLSHRLLSNRPFVGEYFLGSRTLGSWALAFSFAATSASGGSFTGFPSLIYTHGWILALWIASYMVMPIVAMGVMGKRLNQVARKSGAITIPDVIRDRFESTALGLLATCGIIFFTTCNLVAQFKAGGIIIEETFNLPDSWGSVAGISTAYLVGLLAFAFVVVVYTAYGGFRAVVWTDVLQGVVMGVGVIVLLGVIMWQSGGLSAVNETIRDQPPLVVTSLQGKNNDLAFLLKSDAPEGKELPYGIEFVVPEKPADGTVVALDKRPDGRLMIQVRLGLEKPQNDNEERKLTNAGKVRELVLGHPDVGLFLEDIHHAFDNDGSGTWDVDLGKEHRKEYRFIWGDEFLFGPGRRPGGLPFHPMGMAFSFFFMWAISGMGQPGNMLRLMAFKESRTLKRAILTVTVYYGLIYIPLVFIFVSARTLLPYIPQEDSDKSMVLVATRVVAEMGFGYKILAAIFVAAPFAAIMSTVDSFLLIVSSNFVRDIYQRTINPNVSEKAVKWGSYATTAIVGIIVTLLATQKIDFLQYIIVFTGGGFACTFLAPILLGIYWKGMTRAGALTAMIVGFCTVVGMFAPTMFGGQRINLFGLHPVVCGLSVSFLLAVVVSKLTGPAPQHLVERYFYRAIPDTAGD